MANSKSGSNVDNTATMVEFFGIVKIKGVTILNTNIEVVNIRESVFDIIPTLEMTFKDNGLFTQQYTLEDEDEIEIVLAKSSSTEEIVNAKFTLNDYTISNGGGDKLQNSTISLTAFFKCQNVFYPVKTRSFRSMNSVQVLQTIASEIGLDFESKIKTNDNMTWRQVASTNYDMIKDMLSKAYIQNDGVICGINRRKKFLLTSVATSQKNIKSKKAVFEPSKVISNTVDDQDVLYYTNYSIVNSMGTSNKEGGYGFQYGTYDLTTLKSSEIAINDKFLTKYLFKKKENSGKFVGKFGIQIQNFLNVHKNYLTAQAQNEYFVNDFLKFSLILYISPTNAVDLFDIIDVVFPSSISPDSINTVLSGKYVVGGISHSASKDGFFRSALILFRNGFNPSTQIKNAQYTSV